VLAAAAPDAVVFDRFMAEEAFSFRVRAAVPSAAGTHTRPLFGLTLALCTRPPFVLTLALFVGYVGGFSACQ